MKIEAIFFDRDNTIVLSKEDNCYIKHIDDFWIPDCYFKALDLPLIQKFVVTNQGAISLGMTTEKEVKDLNRYILDKYKENGVEFVDCIYCPYHPDGTVPEYTYDGEFDHPMRKPNTGMVDELIYQYGLDPSKCLMVGDSIKDVICGLRAGLASCLVLTEHGQFRQNPQKELEYYETYNDLPIFPFHVIYGIDVLPKLLETMWK